MKRFSLFSFVLLLAAITLTGVAKAGGSLDSYDITVKVKGVNAGDTCMIAYYLGQKQYIRDTVIAEAGGIVHYKGSEKLDGGIYLFVMPGMTYFEFLFVEPKFSLETEKEDAVGKMKVKGSPENEAFFNYLRFIQDKQKEAKALTDLKPTLQDSAKIKEIDAKLAAVDKTVKEFRANQVATHPGTFFATLLHASTDPEVPEAPAGLDSKAAKDFQYRAYRKAYLTYIDWKDDRLLRTPVVQNKIKEYLERLTVEHPDSIILAVEDIVKRAEANPEMFKYCVITITNMYAGTKKMCFDKIYVHMAGNYYVSGRATWVDSTQMAKIKDRYYRMLYNNCDRQAVNLIMQDVDGKPKELFGVNAKYTVVVFWAYDCGHCKKEIPDMYEFYKEYKKHGVEVYAVSTKEDLAKWKEFIQEKGIHDWINVADPENKTNFRILYDILSTPVVYLLDENKTIIGKKLDVPSLKQVLNHELGIETETPQGDH